jgi:uncharacterized protein YajQ (UPF0234 family)
MASFDIVSDVDMQEVDNAVNQASKEIVNRFDFRGSKTTVDLDKNAKLIKIATEDDMKLRAIHQVMTTKLAKRDVDLKALDYGDPEEAGGNTLRQTISLKCGLSKEDAKKITKKIKELKLKVTAQIMDDQVRVTAKKIDDLQSVISQLRGAELDVPLQFVNMRS